MIKYKNNFYLSLLQDYCKKSLSPRPWHCLYHSNTTDFLQNTPRKMFSTELIRLFCYTGEHNF